MNFDCVARSILICLGLVCRYVTGFDSLLVYHDSPQAQYIPCASWEGNSATHNAFGSIVASNPVLAAMQYYPPSQMSHLSSDLPEPMIPHSGRRHLSLKESMSMGTHYAGMHECKQDSKTQMCIVVINPPEDILAH